MVSQENSRTSSSLLGSQKPLPVTQHRKPSPKSTYKKTSAPKSSPSCAPPPQNFSRGHSSWQTTPPAPTSSSSSAANNKNTAVFCECFLLASRLNFYSPSVASAVESIDACFRY